MDQGIKNLIGLTTLYLAEIKSSKLFTLESFERSTEFLFGGLSFFAGTIYLVNLYGLLKPVDLRRSLTFTMIYLYVDHALDSPSLSMKEKNLLIYDFKRIMTKNETSDLQMNGTSDLPMNNLSCDLPMNGEGEDKNGVYGHLKIEKIYREFMGPLEDPCRDVMIHLFDVVVQSVKIQYSDVSMETYLNTSKEKGKFTILAMYIGVTGHFLEASSPIYRDLSKLGECIQLLDDLMDVSDDMKNGIKTIATCHLKTHGSLDRFSEEIREELKHLPELMLPIIELMNGSIDYLIMRSRHFSPRKKRLTIRRLHRYGITYFKIPGIRQRLEKEFREVIAQ